MDPLPLFDRSPQISLAPTQPKEQPGGMFGGGQPPEPKGDLNALLRPAGHRVAAYGDRLERLQSAPEVHRAAAGIRVRHPIQRRRDAFNPRDRRSRRPPGTDRRLPRLVRPLRRLGGPTSPPCSAPTTRRHRPLRSLTAPGFFGLEQRPDPRRPPRHRQDYTLAARIEGRTPAKAGDEAEAEGGDGPIDAIVVMDLDLISDGFFQLRQVGLRGVRRSTT